MSGGGFVRVLWTTIISPFGKVRFFSGYAGVILTRLFKRSFFVTVRNSLTSTTMTKNARASYIVGTTSIAAVEKKKWGHQNCWGYHIVALSNGVTIIERLSKTPTPEAIDLASRPIAGAGAGASFQCPGTSEKRKVLLRRATIA
ncbi:unnamed protein product [Ectocarpus sp. CCAP 1310/34]|nr:unnamed protein product [Ectocarpus sp. CCAP 1310/34]